MTVAIETPYAGLRDERRAERAAQRRVFRSYGAIVLFALFTAVLIVGHAGAILNYAFPVMAAVLASMLIAYRRATYVAFTWWIWLVSPEVRRLVDWHTHFHTISPVMLSPLLVTTIALITILRRPRILLRRALLPFLLFIFVVLFAFVVGVFTNGFLGAAYELGNWLVPLSFGIFLIMDKDSAQEYRQALVSALIIGLVLIGAYGIYQFYHLPPWDAAWLTNSRLHSEGRAVALQVRIFGPLNDSGTYGAVLAASLVFVLVGKGWLRIAAGAVGFPALLLSEERQFWGAWMLAAVFTLWSLGGKSRLRFFFVGIVVAAIAVPILSVGPVANLVSHRLSTITSIQNDRSGTARQDLYRQFFIAAVSQPLGTGFGSLGPAAKLSGGGGNLDSGLLEIPFEFGWIGTLVFVWAMVQIGLSVLKSYLSSKNPITIAASATFFGMMAVLLFGQVFSGAEGMIVWVAVGLVLGTPVPPRRARASIR